MPQATRNVLPDLIGNTLEVVNVVAAAISFVLLWPGVRLLSRLERRMLTAR